MTRESCEICGQPLRNIDFYLAIKGGVICPSCMLTQRSVRGHERQIPDSRVEQASYAPNQMTYERQLFF